MGTTVDTAEAGQETPEIQSARAARQLREERIRFWRVFVVSSFFVVVLGANLIVGAVVMIGNIRTQINSDKGETDGQIARVRRPLLDGTFCRNIVIDNRTALTIEDKVERCDQSSSKSNGKSKSQFSWGGK